MEETYNLKAIILNSRPLGEDDSRVVVYSSQRGKLELVARGTKKIKSKLAGHLEPFSLTEIMAVRGRQYDYVGAAASENCYPNIKNDWEKLAAAGRAVKIFDQLVKLGAAEEKLFFLLKDYFEVLNSSKSGLIILTSAFIFKLLDKLGHRPELYQCLGCDKKITPDGNKFDLPKGGIICKNCGAKNSAERLPISADAIKILRLLIKEDFKKLIKIKLDKKLENEAIGVIDKFLGYHF